VSDEIEQGLLLLEVRFRFVPSSEHVADLDAAWHELRMQGYTVILDSEQYKTLRPRRDAQLKRFADKAYFYYKSARASINQGSDS
jgi:hypothetical protein